MKPMQGHCLPTPTSKQETNGGALFANTHCEVWYFRGFHETPKYTSTQTLRCFFDLLIQQVQVMIIRYSYERRATHMNGLAKMAQWAQAQGEVTTPFTAFFFWHPMKGMKGLTAHALKGLESAVRNSGLRVKISTYSEFKLPDCGKARRR